MSRAADPTGSRTSRLRRRRSTDQARTSRRVDYLCLQPTREGQASRAHVYEIVAGLRRRGWDVQVIEPPHPRPGRLDGVRRVLAGVITQARYWARCRLRPAEFVYIRTHFLSFPTALLARLAGSRVIQEVNGPLNDSYDAWPALRPLHRVLTWIVRTQLRWANAVITVTPGLVDYYAEVTGRSDGFHVVGNGADTSRFVPRVTASGPSSRFVVFVGALASWQGVDTAVAAIGSPNWPAELDLVIAGDGKGRGIVEAASEANHRIRWLGTIPSERAATLVSESSVALVPMIDAPRSAYGLSPLKLFEAMASGVPVVASDLPGLREIVLEHQCGLLFRAGDADDLARAVGEVVRDPARAAEMGANGRIAAVSHYSWDARAGQTERVLLSLVAGSRPAEGNGGRGDATGT